jgi:hypothetical protein
VILGSKATTLVAAGTLALSLGTALVACSDDEPSGSGSQDSPSAAGASSPDATLSATVAQAVTPEHLDPVCPGGTFVPADDVLGTLPPEYAAQAETLLSYECDELIDQVVWAELPDADAAATLPEESGGADVFVAGSTVLGVSERLVDEAGLDTTAYFEALAEACGCGSYDVTSGP